MIYKKMPGLYQDKTYDKVVEEKLVQIDNKKPLHLFSNPQNLTNAKLGVKIGAIEGQNIIAGEDIVLFK